MKLGNISQTIVPIPNFFMDKSSRKLESFNLYKKTISKNINSFNRKKKPISLAKKFKTQINLNESSSNSSKSTPKIVFNRENTIFRDNDILTTFYDLNINNNPRAFTRNYQEMNKEKYIPIYYRKNYPNMTQYKETFFPEIIELNNTNKFLKKNKKPIKMLSLKPLQELYNFKKYIKGQKIQQVFSPSMREDIQNNTKILIDRINMNYDIRKWNEFDSRITYNRFFQTAYSPLNDVIKNTKSAKDQFSKALKQKALSLKTISNKSKEIIKKSIIQNSIEEFFKKENSEEKYDEISFDSLLENSHSNLLKLKYNNCISPQYNNKDKLFIDENKYLTLRLNKTKLYKEFPSKTREEFNSKKVVKYKSLHKNYSVNGKNISKYKYGTDIFNNIKNNEDYYYLKQMWKRPLHKDAFKLHE